MRGLDYWEDFFVTFKIPYLRELGYQPYAKLEKEYQEHIESLNH